jgi:uncharacterized protein (TIGR03437 family)
VLVQIDPPPPVILAAVTQSGAAVSQTNPLKPGQVVILSVSGLTDSSGNPPPASSLVINAGGLNQSQFTVLAAPAAGIVQLEVTLSQNVPFGPAQPIWVAEGTRESAPFNVFILP